MQGGTAPKSPHYYNSAMNGSTGGENASIDAGTVPRSQQPTTSNSSAFDPSLNIELGRQSLGRHSLGLGRHSLAGQGVKAAAASTTGSSFMSARDREGLSRPSIFQDENAMEPEEAETEYSRQAAAENEVSAFTDT